MNTLSLFLHHANDEITNHNYNSFVKFGNDIVPIHDACWRGLPGSYVVPQDAFFQRPKVIDQGYSAADVPYINYIYYNKDKFEKYTHFLLCEFDCSCRCKINELLEYYTKYDVVGSMLFSKGSSWCWFSYLKDIDPNLPLFGIVPMAFVLVEKNAMFKIVDAYKTYLTILSSTNSECRFGSIAKILNFSIGGYEGDLHYNIGYCRNHQHPFQLGIAPDNILYHPCKSIIPWDKILKEREVKKV